MSPSLKSRRKGSSASKDAPSASKDGKGTMGPPPDPLPPALILEPEVDALSACLKNAVVKAGQIYRFFADAQKLGIQKHAPNPPQSITNTLGREVERFDQLCDAIESQLLRAISILERDLAREERRIEESKTAAISTRTRSKSTSVSPSSNRIPLPASSTQTDALPSSQESSASALINSSMPPGRRPSIFLSSLQRPLPPKLDLSSISHRINTEDASLFTGGLASPVTLAPRSARPLAANELPPDLMAFASGTSDADATIDIDLTVPDDTRPSTNMAMDTAANGVDTILDSALGNSADKPIELDLDMDIDMTMTELFGETESSANDGLFSPATTAPDITLAGATGDRNTIKKSEDIGMEIFDALSAVNQSHGSQDLFASLAADPQHNINPGQLNPQSSSMDISTSMPSGTAIAPSPASLLASFESASNMASADPMSSQNVVPDAPFDFDLSTLSPGMLNLADLFNIGEQNDLDTAIGDAGGTDGPV